MRHAGREVPCWPALQLSALYSWRNPKLSLVNASGERASSGNAAYFLACSLSRHKSLAGHLLLTVAPGHLVDRVDRRHSQGHHHLSILASTQDLPGISQVPYHHVYRQEPDGLVPDDHAILKLRQFSLTLVIGLVNGSGAAPAA